MTRERIIELLDLLVLEMGNQLPAPPAADEPPSQLDSSSITRFSNKAADAAEWAYVKGLAAGAVLRLRNELRGVQ